MDRIDRSILHRPSGVIIKHWVKQDPVQPSSPTPQQEETVEPEQSEFDSQKAQTTPDVEELAREHAAKLIDDAQDEADACIAAAKAEAEQIKETAREEGYSAGQAQAAQEQQALAGELRTQFERILNELRAREDGRDAEMEYNILQLSVEIAEKILNISLENDDMVFMGLVKEAVQRLNARDKFAIHLNQREYDRFFAEGSGWLHDAIQSAPFTVSADASIAPGGLLLKSQEGTVRAGVDTQLDKLKHALLSQEEEYDEPV